MKPRKIGLVECQGVACAVYSAIDRDGGWTALRVGGLIMVRATGSDELDLSIAKSFARPRAA